jgi:hypothetical protein
LKVEHTDLVHGPSLEKPGSAHVRTVAHRVLDVVDFGEEIEINIRDAEPGIPALKARCVIDRPRK